MLVKDSPCLPPKSRNAHSGTENPQLCKRRVANQPRNTTAMYRQGQMTPYSSCVIHLSMPIDLAMAPSPLCQSSMQARPSSPSLSARTGRRASPRLSMTGLIPQIAAWIRTEREPIRPPGHVKARTPRPDAQARKMANTKNRPMKTEPGNAALPKR